MTPHRMKLLLQFAHLSRHPSCAAYDPSIIPYMTAHAIREDNLIRRLIAAFIYSTRV
jgi:hypothetical protein